MSDFWQLLIVTVLALFLALPLVWAWRVVWWYLRPPKGQEMADYPRACVILSLRGADPSLAACLRGILHQDYPAYSVRIIIDSQDDPAWDQVQQTLAQGYPGHVDVQVEVLRNPRETCGLKVSAILQAVAGLDDATAVAVLIDADVIPARTWLRSMVEPFHDPQVGAATGVRWYAPTTPFWGTWVRYLWNAAAITQMYQFHIPWGGSLAFRRSLLRTSPLLDFWAGSFCEDTGSYGVLRSLGYKIRFVPAATMVNQESIDLQSCCTFMRRQMLCARLHHCRWSRLLALNIGTGLALVAATGLLLASLVQGWWYLAGWTGGLLGAYAACLGFALLTAERAIRNIQRQRGDRLAPFYFTWKIIPAGLLTQVLHFTCLISALRLRRIAWRGITYEFSDGTLRRLDYQPYQPPSQINHPDGSLL